MDPLHPRFSLGSKAFAVSGSLFFAGVSETSDPIMMGLWRHLLAVVFAASFASGARRLPKLSDDTTCLTAERQCLGRLDAAAFCYKMVCYKMSSTGYKPL